MYIMNKNTYTNTKPKLGNIDYTFNVCYLREYMDPEQDGDFFYAYETVYRNIPYKYKDKFNAKSMKMKIIKFCDWNYKETANNFAKTTRVELINQDQYYQTYKDVFGDVAEDNDSMFNDYGQKFDRQSLRKDFNPALTTRKVGNSVKYRRVN